MLDVSVGKEEALASSKNDVRGEISSGSYTGYAVQITLIPYASHRHLQGPYSVVSGDAAQRCNYKLELQSQVAINGIVDIA